MRQSYLHPMSVKSAKKEHSYGIVPLRNIESNWHVLLIRHASAKHWGFPKGHPESGESALQAAKRELKEETNLDVVRLLSDLSFDEHYEFWFYSSQISKTVTFYAAEVRGDLILQKAEVSGSQWLPLAIAEDALTYDTDKSILKKVALLLNRSLL